MEMPLKSRAVTVMGIFAADLSFRTGRLPGWGETVMGSAFRPGPGGKGSNQAIAAARLGGVVNFISKVGTDSFGELARIVNPAGLLLCGAWGLGRCQQSPLFVKVVSAI
jgi:hypothetical protein